MKIFKKILKWTGITIGVLFIFLLIAPFLFKDKIESAIKDVVNKQINASVNWSSVDLSFIKSFPNLRVSVEDLSVVNTMAPFDSVRLASIGSLEAVVDIKSLFGDQISIKRIGIVKPNFDVRVNKEGLANYDIAKPDSTTAVETPETEAPSKFNILLKEYFIEEGTISYVDETFPMTLKINGLNHNGKGDFTQDLFELVTSTQINQLTCNYDGITYLKEIKSNLDLSISMDMVNSKYTLASNEIKINELILGAEGWIAMPGENIDMDISFKALKNDFKQFLSLVPMEFAKDLSGVDVTGSLTLDGFVKGTYNETSLPSTALNILVENGRFKYPDLPKSVENIQIKTSILADLNNEDNTTIDVEKFHFDMANNPVDLTLKLRNPVSDPFIDFACKAFLDLDNIKEFIPLEKGDNVHGQINADVAVKGNFSSAESGNYEKFDAKGVIDIKNVLFQSDSTPYDVDIKTATFNFSPAFVELSNFNSLIGKSDIQAMGKISNYLAYALRDSLLVGNFTMSSQLLDLNEFMSETTTPTETTQQSNAGDTSAMSPVELPENVDFTFDASIGKILFDKNEITNVKGGVSLKDKIATLRNFAMNVIDGSVVMSGQYNAQNLEKPKMNFAFDIKNMDINKAANQFNTIEKMAPIAKACNGKFSTKFAMLCDLSQGMIPINPTVNGAGILTTKGVIVKDFAPIVKLAEKINLDKLKEPLTINDITVSFKIKDGVVNVDPFTVKLIEGMPTKIYGYTTLDQDINYNLEMDVPIDKFASGALSQANTWIGELNKKLGSNISVGNKVNVIAVITGTVTDPKIGVTSKALGADAVNDLKAQAIEAAKEQIVEKASEIRDDLVVKAKAEKEKLVDEAKKQAAKFVAEAQVQADRVKKEGEVLAKKGKDETYKAADDLLAKAKNPLEKAGIKIAADKMKKEADSAYQKAVEKTNKEADKGVELARKKGDDLVKSANDKGDGMIKDAEVKSQQGIDKAK